VLTLPVTKLHATNIARLLLLYDVWSIESGAFLDGVRLGDFYVV
jgi:hypothetical protein